MDKIYITDININKIRHLENITIPLQKDSFKHLILTGINGSGKTSILEAIASYLLNCTYTKNIILYSDIIRSTTNNLNYYFENKTNNYEESISTDKALLKEYQQQYNIASKGIELNFSTTLTQLHESFINGNFITAYYKAYRVFKTTVPNHIEKVQLKNNYSLEEDPRQNLLKYLLDLKTTQAFSTVNQKFEKAKEIENWFNKFESLLRDIFRDDQLKLIFEEESFKFVMIGKNKQQFDFNNLSSGYGAVLDIIVDLIIRMEKQTNRTFNFNMSGIVLIDEIETHLHLELQKRIFKLLTTIFPNIQFIITTHSPFILNSSNNIVIYDLEKNIHIENGLSNVSYEGIVEGFFNSESISNELKTKFLRYKELTSRENLLDKDFEEILALEFYLDEIPDYLSLNLTTEYLKLKTKFENRTDIL